MSPEVRGFLDLETSTIFNVVSDPEIGDSATIDPVLDYDGSAGRTSTRSMDTLIQYIDSENLNPVVVLETHVHADHLTGAKAIVQRYTCPIGIGCNIDKVQYVFRRILNTPDVAIDGSLFGFRKKATN